MENWESSWLIWGPVAFFLFLGPPILLVLAYRRWRRDEKSANATPARRKYVVARGFAGRFAASFIAYLWLPAPTDWDASNMNPLLKLIFKAAEPGSIAFSHFLFGAFLLALWVPFLARYFKAKPQAAPSSPTPAAGETKAVDSQARDSGQG